MNLHDLHNEPKSLDHHDDQDLVPVLAWTKYHQDQNELKKREKMWARDPQTAYWYARDVLHGPFKIGELAIAKDSDYSYLYAKCVLKGPFKLGELAIANSRWKSEIW